MIGGRDEDRHAVVERAHRLVRRGGDDGEGGDRVAAGAAPVLPQSGECERCARSEPDEVSLLPSARDWLPFVEAVGRDEAAPAAERGAERRLVGHALGAGVEHPAADRGVLRPRRNEAPAEHHRLALAGRRLAHDERVHGRGDVVARRVDRHLAQAEVLGDDFSGRGEDVAAAHAAIIPSPRKNNDLPRRCRPYLHFCSVLCMNTDKGGGQGRGLKTRRHPWTRTRRFPSCRRCRPAPTRSPASRSRRPVPISIPTSCARFTRRCARSRWRSRRRSGTRRARPPAIPASRGRRRRTTGSSPPSTRATSIDDLAVAHARSRLAIEARLARFGRVPMPAGVRAIASVQAREPVRAQYSARP